MSSDSSQKIGLMTLTALVTGNLVGSGVFMLPATLAAFGSICIGGWVFTSIGAILLSLVFATLSARRPKTGGPHTYVEDAFGRQAGFYIAWGYWVLSWSSSAAVVIAAIGYASSLFDGFSPITAFLLEVAVIVVVAGINLYGVRAAARFELVLLILKIVPLIAVPLVGLFYLKADNFMPLNGSNVSDFSALNATALLTLWAFVGLESGTVPGDAVQNPQKNIPRAVLLGTLLATFIYLIGTVAIMGVVPHAELMQSKAPYSDLASILFGGAWGMPIAIAAVICCIGTFNGWTFVVARIALGAAKDGLFPALFSKVTKNDAPIWGVVISCVLTVPLVALSLSESLLQQFNFIIEFSLALFLIIYIVCILAYFVILKRDDKLDIKSIIIGIVSLAFCLWTLSGADISMLMCSVAVLASGIPVWMYQRRKYIAAVSV